MIDTNLLLDEVAFAKAMLAKETLSGSDMVFILHNLLKMKYYPVAVKFFFSEAETSEFKSCKDVKTSTHPLTFCHFVAASRQAGRILVGTPEKIGCTNAKYVLGLKELDENEIKSHLKYAKNAEQAERFIKSKFRLQNGLVGFATAPLHKAPYIPDVIHGVCDVLQSYHLANHWCAAFDTPTFQMTMTTSSSVCHGVVSCHLNQKPNISQMCSGSYTSGKTEQGEINWIWPGSHLEPTIRWMLERVLRDGSISFPRVTEPYPGFNVCKLCPFIAFTNPKKT